MFFVFGGVFPETKMSYMDFWGMIRGNTQKKGKRSNIEYEIMPEMKKEKRKREGNSLEEISTEVSKTITID
jgi:hypothetical protein